MREPSSEIATGHAEAIEPIVAAYAAHGYRPEVDGLRALAVMPVILYHAGFSAFSGGFVGVDIFFVISGYLITGIIVTEKAAGKFSVAEFYERRARRILPALFFVMMVCLPFAWRWMLPDQLLRFAESVGAVVLFASNMLFWQESGYFEPSAEQNVLLHTWSLAVEEQYYLVFPLLVTVLWRLGIKRLVAGVFFLTMASLVLSEWSCQTGRIGTAFYLAPTRAWELLVGALVALTVGWRTVRSIGRSAGLLATVGIALVAYAIAFFDRTTLFPGMHALAPVIGTALVLMFGHRTTWVARVLSGKLLVGVGLISYSAYLWHQPLFAFARVHALGKPHSSTLLLLTGLTLGLAYLTWRFVERPLRNRKHFSRQQIFGLGAGISSLFLLIAFVGWRGDGFAGRWSVPSTIAASLAETPRPTSCFDRPRSKGFDPCVLGAEDPTVEFLVFGDSHALALLPAFEVVARETGRTGAFAGASGCIPFQGLYALRTDQAEKDCHWLNAQVLEFVQRRGIDTVFLVARWTYYTDGGYDGEDFSYIGSSKDAPRTIAASRGAFMQGLEATLLAYERIGVRLILVNQVPQQRYDPRQIYFRAYAADDSLGLLHEAAVSRAEHLKLQAFVRDAFAARAGKAFVITLDSLLCDAIRCPFGTPDQSYYFDEDHLSAVGAKRVQEGLRRVLMTESTNP